MARLSLKRDSLEKSRSHLSSLFDPSRRGWSTALSFLSGFCIFFILPSALGFAFPFFLWLKRSEPLNVRTAGDEVAW